MLEAAPADTPRYKLYNIGNNEPVELTRFIDILEECLGRKAERCLLPMQPGDVPATLPTWTRWSAMSASARALR